MEIWGALLQALGHVPGFEWAKEAGNKMRDAAGEARNMANEIMGIPAKKDVNITFFEKVVRSVEFANIESSRDAATASRGRRNALGTRNFQGGGTWVGEQGPEWVNLPRGSQIVANHKLNDPSTWAGFNAPAPMAASAPSPSAGLGGVEININAPETASPRQIADSTASAFAFAMSAAGGAA